jgi:uncharacterized membrane protein
MPETPARGVMIVLAYLWPLALVPLVLEKHDAEVRWHARHGLVLMAAELALAAVFAVVALVASLTTLAAASAVIVIAVVLWFGVFALHALGAIKGLAGSRLYVPRLSRLADRTSQA